MKLNNIFIPIVFGICISLIYNIIVYSLNIKFNFTNIYELSKLPIIVQIISSGICGPILEEFLFRGLVYNKLKTFNKKKS
ncbi:MAG: CPBP family intramembrane metalloprotease, partial [Clostridia bacterium]|nr:CPBP family intramembrane metalloprotease [Clostridia bacterium]